MGDIDVDTSNDHLKINQEKISPLNDELTNVHVELRAEDEEHEACFNDFACLLSSVDIGLILLDTGFRIRAFTPRVRELMGVGASNIGRSIIHAKRQFDDPDLIGDCQHVLNDVAAIEKEVISTEGRAYLRRILPYCTADNRISGIVVTFVDVSAIKQAEQAQRDNEDRSRIIAEGAPDFAIVLMDAQRRILTWNGGAEYVLGFSEKEAIGKDAVMIYPPPDAEEAFNREKEKAMRDGRALDETWHVRKNGERFWGSGVLTAIRNTRGELTGFVKVLRDETVRKQIEDERDALLNSERAARQEAEQASYVKDQFLARLSHELRTPLSSILTWAEILRHGRMGPEETVEGLKVIERSALAQAQLLNDLLEVSRIASGKMRLQRSDTKLPALVRLAVEALKPIAEERGVHVEMKLQTDGCHLRADPDRLRQVVSNLLTNAIKFTPSGGRVTVEVSRHEDVCEVVVSDTGQGIDPEFLPHIFTPFSQADFSMTRSYGGLGLGLSVCKELVELHGGTIEARSEGVGHGATFIVRLPASGMPALESEEPEDFEEEPRSNSLQETKLLLVEDELLTLDSLARVLRSYGAEVTAVATADAAVTMFASSPPQVIISDVGLPREDGYQLLQRIRAMEKERGMPPTPAIALSAFAGVKHRRQAREAGFNKHFPKPTKVAPLVNTIVKLLAARNES